MKKIRKVTASGFKGSFETQPRPLTGAKLSRQLEIERQTWLGIAAQSVCRCIPIHGGVKGLKF